MDSVEYKLQLPLKTTKFGEVKSLADFMAAVRTYGQDFLGNGVPACQVIPGAPCDISCYQYWGKNSHGGLDIPAPKGTPVYAATQGIVQEVSDDMSAGLGVVIWDDSQRIKTLYWHNLKNLVVVGQRVEAGDHIADVDSTGYSTGHHLHFELKRTDDKGNTIDKDNGWRGAIDPAPYLVFGDDMALTKEEVAALQELEGYNDEEGQEYWGGKQPKALRAYLVARLEDKIKKLSEKLQELKSS